MTGHKSGRLLPFLLFTLAGLFLTVDSAQGYVIVFKDGFSIQGQIKQERMFIGGAGAVFAVPVGGVPYWIETKTSNITFSPTLIHDILNDPPSNMPKWMDMKLYPPGGKESMPPSWQYYKVGDWNDKWERVLQIAAPNPKNPAQSIILDDKQRVTDLNPYFIRVGTSYRMWAPFYHPDEFGPDVVKKLLAAEYAKNKEPNKTLTKFDKCLKTAQFLAHCGWLDAAEQELKDYAPAGESEKSKIESDLAVLAKQRAMEFAASLELAFKMGRYNEVDDKLEIYAKNKLDKIVGEDMDLEIFRVKDKYGTMKKKIVQAQQMLQGMAAVVTGSQKEFYQEAQQTIQKELNYHTLDRLETFMEQAEVFQLDLKNKRTPSFSADQLMAFALTGWLLGKNAAEENPEFAEKLWKARDFVLKYQNTPNSLNRDKQRADFAKNFKLDLDALAKLIHALPPPRPHAQLNSEVQQINFTPPQGGQGGTYHIQLPPEYHHYRSYPVLVVLHDGGQTAPQMLAQWAKLAAKFGYILVAPAWANGKGEYGYSEDEQYFLMNVLRDLRSRFQIDNDRVFLFGLGQGGQYAYDAGMAHPDQFAGVLPMAAFPKYQAWNCRTNGQYLPFYTVDGTLNTFSAIENDKLFKDWVQWRYPSLWIEYKGRGMEWFSGELPTMMDWMNRKRRHFPKQQVGSVHTGGGKGDEFCTMRKSDNRFYWIGTKSIRPQYLKDHTKEKWQKNWVTAKMAATIYASNQILSDNQIYIYGTGIDQVSIWLAQGMIDFSKKTEVRFNGTIMQHNKLAPSLDVLLEDFYEQGDRSRLFIVRIDLGKG